MFDFLKKSGTPEQDVVQAIHDFTYGTYPQPTTGALFDHIVQLAEISPSTAFSASRAIRKKIDLRRPKSNNVRKNALVLFLALLHASAKSSTQVFITRGVNSSNKDAIRFDVSSPGLELAIRQNPAISDYLNMGVQHESSGAQESAPKSEDITPVASSNPAANGDIKFLAVYHYMLIHSKYDAEVHTLAVDTIKAIAQAPEFSKFESMQGLRHLYSQYANDMRFADALQASVIESKQYSGKAPLNMAGIKCILSDGQAALDHYAASKDSPDAKDGCRRILSVIRSLDERNAFVKFPLSIDQIQTLKKDLEAVLA
ncbi:hypothetical protein NADFUDRAFT_47508 [Nadsonia fulvescens var. elongata DSM 6958]|uniref:Uncharacterized protein n=1 Tax=Nadsonia fulvescens var. elongata DSM 6958 TaxID=857566 RepID=A0A1E3PFT6_9ASCO|nr:hypothetical protein NADFUDRAFT_47508 [Nadsonia fulvescens var. elongata DSM 6958]